LFSTKGSTVQSTFLNLSQKAVLNNDLKNGRWNGCSRRIIDGRTGRLPGGTFSFIVQFQFPAKNQHVRWCFDADTDFVPGTANNGHGDGIADSNPLSFST
jgi:hypothetical protein